jgi:hypothetical protein
MNQQQMNIIIFTIFMIILAITLNAFLNNMKEIKTNNNICQDLGYDEYWYNGVVCIKDIGFNKQTGKRIKCYMPFEFKLTAEEWCKNETN